MISRDIKFCKFLCQGCGACFLVCPRGAISLVPNKHGLIYPRIDKAKCDLCGACSRSCPVHNQKHSHDADIFENIFGSFVGCASDNEARFLSTSGGIASATLKWALDKNIVDAAVCVKPSSRDPRLAEFTVIQEGETEKIKTSRYIFVNLTGAFENLDLLKQFNRLALVGLSCHVRALRNLKDILNLRNIYFTIGLICNQTKDLRFVDFILERMNAKKEDIADFFYRSRGYPGKSIATLRDNSQKEYPFQDYGFIYGNFCFAPPGCFYCSDPVPDYADIVAGDPWMKKFRSEKAGVNLILTRTPRGKEIIDKAVQDKFINVTPLSRDELLSTDSMRIFKFKKHCFLEKLKLAQLTGKHVPWEDFQFKGKASLLRIINVARVSLSSALLEALFSIGIFRKLPRLLNKVLYFFSKV